MKLLTFLAKLNPADAGIPENPLTQTTVNNVANAAFMLAGIVAVVFIIIGGISYSISAGDPGKISKAKDTILYAVIGLIVVLVSFIIVQFVI
jgi:hypothetical protein